MKFLTLTLVVALLCGVVCASLPPPLCQSEVIRNIPGCDCANPCRNGSNCGGYTLCKDRTLIAMMIAGGQVVALPENIGDLSSLEQLELNFNTLVELPASFSNLSNLALLNFNFNTLSDAVWEEITQIDSISLLYLKSNCVKTLPEDFGPISRSLRYLDLSENMLDELGSGIASLTALAYLLVDANQIVDISESGLEHMTSLVQLKISNNLLTALPESIGRLTRLIYFDVATNNLESLPASLCSLTRLNALYVANNKLSGNINISTFKNLFVLDMRYTNTTFVSESVLNAPWLTSLLISGNKLDKDTDFSRMENLKYLYLEDCALEAVPALPVSMETLWLNRNSFSKLSEQIAECKNLIYLSLQSNSLARLPDIFDNFPKLSRLNLLDNRLTQLPKTLLDSRVKSITLDGNCLNCDEIHEKFNGSIFDRACIQDKQTGCVKKDITTAIIAVIVCIVAVLAVVLVIVLLRLRRTTVYLHKLRVSSSAINMRLLTGHEGLIEMDEDHEKYGVQIEPKELTFGTASTQVPLDVDLEDHFTIVGVGNKLRTLRGKGKTFELEVPEVAKEKYIVSASSLTDIVRPGEMISVTVKLRMLCTTTLDLPIYVIIGSAFTVVRIRVASQLSTRIDADEVTCGDVLGAGSFGTVYRGEWRGNSDLAVKAYNASILADIGLKADIEREVEMCFKLRNPNVVTFYGRTVQPERLYIVMELVPHGSLGSLLKKGPIDLRFKVRVALDTAKGMNYLHKNCVIHRDLKSDNVLLASLDPNTSVVAKLSDFNTSRFWGSDALRTKTKGVGTPIFMAPEILDGKHYSWQADVYSFGVMLWHMWSQTEPYAEFASSLQLFKFVLEGHRLEMPQDLPEELKQITANAWKHSPEERPSFQSLVQSLVEFLAHMA